MARALRGDQIDTFGRDGAIRVSTRIASGQPIGDDQVFALDWKAAAS